MNESSTNESGMRIECIDKKGIRLSENIRVCIELDNKSIDFLIDVLLDLKNAPGVHHYNLDSGFGFSQGWMTKDSNDLILNNRDKYYD